MSINRLFRILVCLVMVLSLLVTLSPLKAHATLVGALPVAVPVAAPLVLGAVIIGLGIMCATDAGVFDGVIAKCQEALSSSGLISDGQMDVISYDGKAYVPENTVEAVRSALFSTTVLYEGLDRIASIKAGTKFTDPESNSISIVKDCYAFAYRFSGLSTYSLVLLPYAGDSADSLAKMNGSYMSSKSVYTSSGWVYFVDYVSLWESHVSSLSINRISNSTDVGDAIEAFYSGEFDFSPKTTVLTDYAVALGNVVPDDEDLQTGYPGWYNNAVVIEGTGGSGGTPSDEDHYIALPIEVPGSSSDLEDMTQDEVQDGGELIVETPGGTTSGSGISETWLGQELAILGDLLSGIKNAIIELPNKFATWFEELIGSVVTLGEHIINGEWLTGLQVFFSDMYSLWFGDLITGIESLGETITTAWNAAIEAVSNVLRDIFVPSEDYLTEKVEALRDEFGFADSIITTFDMFRTSLFKFETSPPVIYVDLSNNRGPYDMGGQAAILDLRWYEEYKPTVDALISAFMWLVFVWRVGLHLPGTLRGASGEVPGSIVPSSEEKGIVVSRWIYDK